MSLEGVEDAHALTAVQHGMLFHSLQTEKGDGGQAEDDYLAHIVIELSGQRDVQLLKKAWARVYAHHAILRSYFLWEGLEEPLCLVRATIDIPWTVVHASSVDDVDAVVVAERRLGMALTEAPLTRISLLEFSPTKATLIWTVHHLLADGWSTPIVLADVMRAYSALQRGESPTLEPSWPYQQFVNWQAGRNLDVLEAYWRHWLAGRTPTPLQIVRPQQGAIHVPRRNRVDLPIATTSALASLCREQRITLSTLIIGAWALALRLYVGSSSPLFGLTVAGRPLELSGIERAIGLFINVLPLQVDCQTDQSFTQWLQQIQRTVQQHSAHEQLAYQDIQRLTLSGFVVGDAGRIPRFDVGAQHSERE